GVDADRRRGAVLAGGPRVDEVDPAVGDEPAGEPAAAPVVVEENVVLGDVEPGVETPVAQVQDLAVVVGGVELEEEGEGEALLEHVDAVGQAEAGACGEGVDAAGDPGDGAGLVEALGADAAQAAGGAVDRVREPVLEEIVADENGGRDGVRGAGRGEGGG